MAVLLALAYVLRHALLLLYISAVFAVVLNPAVERVHRLSIFGWRPSRGAALLLLVGVVLVGIGMLATFGLPPLISDVRDFAGRLPSMIAELRARLRHIPFLSGIDLGQAPAQIVSATGGIAANVSGAVASVFTVLLMIAYFILDGNRLLGGLLSLFPAEPRERLGHTLDRAGRRMRGWLAGQLMLMLILGVSSGITFGFMRIPYFYFLAVFAGFANIIPFLGPIATVVLAGLVALTQSTWKLVGVLIFYLVYQQVENAFLTPRIMKSQVQLSSAVVLIALLIGSELAGVPGALVAVPSAVLIVEIADEYLVQRK